MNANLRTCSILIEILACQRPAPSDRRIILQFYCLCFRITLISAHIRWINRRLCAYIVHHRYPGKYKARHVTPRVIIRTVYIFLISPVLIIRYLRVSYPVWVFSDFIVQQEAIIWKLTAYILCGQAVINVSILRRRIRRSHGHKLKGKAASLLRRNLRLDRISNRRRLLLHKGNLITPLRFPAVALQYNVFHDCLVERFFILCSCKC